MSIKKLIISISVLTFFPSLLLADTAKITSMEGEVIYLTPGADDWKDAAVGTELAMGDRIESQKGAWAELEFSNGHVAKLGSGSSMQINSIGKETSLEMFKGNIISKVKKLKKKQAYNVVTPQSVCAVRGTEFNVMVGQNTRVVVYEGSVMAKEIATGSEVVVPAGKFTIVVKNEAPAEPDDIENMPADDSGDTGKSESGDEETANKKTEDEGSEEATEEGDSEETELAEGESDENQDETGEEASSEDSEAESDQDLAASDEPAEEDNNDDSLNVKNTMKQDLRAEMQEAVADIKVDVGEARDIVETTKETDSSTGRTLRDIHGNLVRIEQYLLRPQNNTVQFINITKRSGYNYKGKMNVAATGARLDSVELKATFNMDMPEKISDWTDFFKNIDDNDLDFHPQTVNLKMTNKTDTMEVSSHWEGTDSDGDLSDPVFKLTSGTEGTWNVVIDERDDFAAGSNRYNLLNYEDNGMAYGDENSAEAWAISPKMLLYKDLNNDGIWDEAEATASNTMFVRSGIEGWVINNDGKLIDFDMFEGNDMNPFEVVKDIAFETSIVYRYSTELNSDASLILNQDYDDGNWTDAQEAAYQAEALAAFNRGSNFFSNNIDLVVTPDFIIPIMEEVAKGGIDSL